MDNKGFTFTKRIKSFKYAFQGICQLIHHEHNAWIHTIAAVLVCIAGFFFGISAMEWICIIICIALVLAAEAFNTVIEKMADFISPGYHDTIKAIKDIAAGGVLLIAIAAAITGGIIFLPKIIAYFG